MYRPLLRTHRILLITLAFLGFAFILPTTVGAQPPVYVTQWGSSGSGNGQFGLAFGVAVDAAGNVYIADASNNRIQKFTSTGTYLTQWGSFGSGNGQFNNPNGVATDAAGNVYVVEQDNHRIQKFSSTGTYLTQWGSFGFGNGQFRFPRGVATDVAGNVYVADWANDRIQKFTDTGTYLTQWGSFGSGNGQFRSPRFVATDAAGNVYVSDDYCCESNERIQKFTSTGSYLTQWGSYGSGNGQFQYPEGVATDGAGNVYVADSGNNRIQEFTSGGTYVTQWGSYGTGNGQFFGPTGVATDAAGNVYVVDANNYRIQKFGPPPPPPSFTQTCFSDNLAPAMAVGDFNHDGKLDVAINPGGQQIPFFLVNTIVDVYLGNGDGTFSGPTHLNAGGGYLDMAAGDLNNDGNLDLVTATSPLSVLLGNGNGTFQPMKSYAGGNAAGIVVGDMNEDGLLDLAVADGQNKVASVLLNKGNGTFKDRVQYRTGDANRAITIGDFNGDRHLDLVTLNGGSPNGVSVLLGNGKGMFGHDIDTPLPGFPGRDLAAADFDGDGKLDLVVPLQGGDGVLVLRGNGNGTFGAPASYPMPGNTLHVASGDLNGDGRPDIVAGNYLVNNPNPGGTVSVLYGDGSGAFSPTGGIPVAFGFGVLVADINGDSRSDIVADGCVLLQNGPAASVAAAGIARAGQPIVAKVAGISPNPLRDRGTLSFSLPKDGKVSVHLYDLQGRQVATLMESAWFTAGPHTLPLDRHETLSKSGLYFYRIESDAGTTSGRIVVLDN